MTSTITAAAGASDQSDRAVELITLWLAEKPDAQDRTLARIIAATVHTGAGSALEHFAATGRLNAPRALDELNAVHVPIEREPWIDALGQYIIATPPHSWPLSPRHVTGPERRNP